MDIPSRFSVAIVGGDWNAGGGRPSNYVQKLAKAIAGQDTTVYTFNGGQFIDLSWTLHGLIVRQCDAIIWMANVPNDLPKQRNIKFIYPHKLLVGTKRNQDEYSFQELVNRALGMKANLCVDFKRDGEDILARIFDPLGVAWLDYTSDIQSVAITLVRRLKELKAFTRQATNQIDPVAVSVPFEEEFFDLVKGYADVFHDLVSPATGVTRFLGNSSFRCARGFPSLRDQTQDLIFVSRRNIDKRFIDASAFVAVRLDGEEVVFWGPKKPSVDTPIQVRLYKALPQINFMLHAHVYMQCAPTTRRALPCGAVEEVNEILECVSDKTSSFIVVNLLGHGCIIMSDRPEKMRNAPFYARPVPEYL